MEIQGKIVEVFPLRSGETARGTWQSQDYLLETQEQYPKKMFFSVTTEDRIKRLNIQKGQLLTVSFDVDAREYNGRWYNQIRAWAVQPVQSQAPAQPQQNAGGTYYAKDVANQQPPQEQEDDLPF